MNLDLSLLSLKSQAEPSQAHTATFTGSLITKIQPNQSPFRNVNSTIRDAGLNAPIVKRPINCLREFDRYFVKREGLPQDYVDVIAATLSSSKSANDAYMNGFLDLTNK